MTRTACLIGKRVGEVGEASGGSVSGGPASPVAAYSVRRKLKRWGFRVIAVPCATGGGRRDV